MVRARDIGEIPFQNRNRKAQHSFLASLVLALRKTMVAEGRAWSRTVVALSSLHRQVGIFRHSIFWLGDFFYE
jgi:hypothetical protein